MRIESESNTPLNPFKKSKRLIIDGGKKFGFFEDSIEDLKKESIPSIFGKLRRCLEDENGNINPEAEKKLEEFFISTFYKNNLLPNVRSAGWLGKVLSINWLSRKGFRNPETVKRNIEELQKRLYEFSDYIPCDRENIPELIEIVENIGLEILNHTKLNNYGNLMDILIFFENENVLESKMRKSKLTKDIKNYTINNLKK